MKKLLWVLEGLFWCTAKGALAVLFRRPIYKRDWMENLFGWREDIIDRSGRDVWAEQVSLARGGRSHHRTDLIVEWVKLHGQRGTKLLCFLSFVTFLTGIVLGYIIS
jgi:hypothetical protein